MIYDINNVINLYFKVMEKKKVIKLTDELNMKFVEASELFSEETLRTMRLLKIAGGVSVHTDHLCDYVDIYCDTPKNKKCDTDVNVIFCDEGGDDITIPTEEQSSEAPWEITTFPFDDK